MAKTIKSLVNTATFSWKGNSIDLRAEFEKMELLSEAVGMDAINYIQSVSTPREMSEVFYHLQHDSEFDRNLIYNGFFASIADFMDPEYQAQMAATFSILLGADKAKVLAELAALNAVEDTPKKSAD